MEVADKLQQCYFRKRKKDNKISSDDLEDWEATTQVLTLNITSIKLPSNFQLNLGLIPVWIFWSGRML